MTLPRLNVYRHNNTRALITLAGEIDLNTTPLLSTALATCARGGIRTTDVDLTVVTFCDVSGLNAFLTASRHATEAGTSLQLHYPPPVMARVIEITGSGFLLHEPHAARPPSHRVLATAGGAP